MNRTVKFSIFNVFYHFFLTHVVERVYKWSPAIITAMLNILIERFALNFTEYGFVKRYGEPREDKSLQNRKKIKVIGNDSDVFFCTGANCGTIYTTNVISQYLHRYSGSTEESDLYSQRKKFVKRFGEIFFEREEVNPPTIPYIYLSHPILSEVDYYQLFKGKKILLFRNPLDLMAGLKVHPYYRREFGLFGGWNRKAAFVGRVHYYAARYNLIRSLEKEGGLFFFYEELISNPKKVFSEMIQHIGLDLNEQWLDESIEVSSIKKVKEYEKDKGLLFGETRNDGKEKSTHIASGKIGKWKGILTKKEISTIKSILKQHNISLDEFILE